MSEKWTNGPWNVLESNNSSLIHVETGEGCPEGQGIQIATTNRGNREQRYANASLIAAAPELFEALEAIAVAWDSPKERQALKFEMLEKAKAALAKARGEAQ